MSASPGSGGGFPDDPSGEKALMMAQHEMEFRVELFNSIANQCYEKCIDKSKKDGELSVGENSCIDRCVQKYWQVTGLVGQMLGNNMGQ